MKTDKVFVIIVTFNGIKYIYKCLKSVDNYNIIVVDNGSTDGTQNYIKSNFPMVTFIQSKKNVGFGKANNIGLKYAIKNDCDYVYLLNQDAWVFPDTIKILIDIHKKNSRYGVLSPIHLNGSCTKLDKNFATYCQDYYCNDFLSDLYLKKLKNVYDIDFVNAAHWLISRDCINKIGGFAPIFPHYGEDNNFIDRVHYMKLEVGICTNAKGVHDRETKSNNKFQYIAFINFLKKANDINHNINIYKLLYSLMRDEIHLLKFGFFSAGIFFIKGCSLIHKIKKTRKTTKIEGASFL